MESSETLHAAVHSDIEHSKNVRPDTSEVLPEELNQEFPSEGWSFEAEQSNTVSVAGEELESISSKSNNSGFISSGVTPVHDLAELNIQNSLNCSNDLAENIELANSTVGGAIEKQKEKPSTPEAKL